MEPEMETASAWELAGREHHWAWERRSSQPHRKELARTIRDFSFFLNNIKKRSDKGCSHGRDNCIPSSSQDADPVELMCGFRRRERGVGLLDGAAKSHATTGNPCNQRLKAGLSAARFSVEAGEPGVAPAAKLTCRPSSPLIGVFSSVLAPSLWSRVVGVPQPASCAAIAIGIPAPFPFLCFAFNTFCLA